MRAPLLTPSFDLWTDDQIVGCVLVSLACMLASPAEDPDLSHWVIGSGNPGYLICYSKSVDPGTVRFSADERVSDLGYPVWYEIRSLNTARPCILELDAMVMRTVDGGFELVGPTVVLEGTGSWRVAFRIEVDGGAVLLAECGGTVRLGKLEVLMGNVFLTVSTLDAGRFFRM